ncbi:hypothetical protein C2E23DRAFT_371751 [Lenzites betulinus]|nr:hypothetical protein C2E23DRAFT_371751 [Lenzites betulinus]
MQYFTLVVFIAHFVRGGAHLDLQVHSLIVAAPPRRKHGQTWTAAPCLPNSCSERCAHAVAVRVLFLRRSPSWDCCRSADPSGMGMELSYNTHHLWVYFPAHSTSTVGGGWIAPLGWHVRGLQAASGGLEGLEDLGALRGRGAERGRHDGESVAELSAMSIFSLRAQIDKTICTGA